MIHAQTNQLGRLTPSSDDITQLSFSLVAPVLACDWSELITDWSLTAEVSTCEGNLRNLDESPIRKNIFTVDCISEARHISGKYLKLERLD